jgi:alkanesulfonate monooxygenase SsuD/methylene tetrahydromethanopterin reductase-like flavin-dependent oxidoreductase (luciferase family)
VRIGYFLSSEQHGIHALVDQARRAEAAGFAGLWVSDHFHPWSDAQGHSPFVWSTIAAVALATERLTVTTAVTCPTVRIHPAVLAQATATSAVLLDGRFRFGVGTGEALNEHILGGRWPAAPERLEMLEEAIAVIRLLWGGARRAIAAATIASRTPASTTCRSPRRRSSSPASAPGPSRWPRASATASPRSCPTPAPCAASATRAAGGSSSRAA